MFVYNLKIKRTNSQKPEHSYTIEDNVCPFVYDIRIQISTNQHT